MTNEEAKKMLKAKLECLKNETSGINHDCNMRLCDGCSLNYEQGNMGEQKEALEMAIQALEQQPKMGEWLSNPLADYAGEGYFICSKCENDVFDATDYCPNCGARMNGGGEDAE